MADAGTYQPSSSNENEHTNREVVCGIRAPSPEILTLTVGSSSTESFNCNQGKQNNVIGVNIICMGHSYFQFPDFVSCSVVKF